MEKEEGSVSCFEIYNVNRLLGVLARHLMNTETQCCSDTSKQKEKRMGRSFSVKMKAVGIILQKSTPQSMGAFSNS